MLRIALHTLPSRRGTLAGAFVAICLAVALGSSTGSLMAGALEAPGSGRLGAADLVVRADPTVRLGGDAGSLDAIPGPRLDAAMVERVARVPGVRRAVGDVAVTVAVRDAHGRALGAGRVRAHDWSGAALTPYALTAGRTPTGPREVVADAQLGVRAGAVVRIVAPNGTGAYRVTGIARAGEDRNGGQVALFLPTAAVRGLAGAPGQIDAVGVQADPGTAPAALRAALAQRLGAGVEVVEHRSAAYADAGDGRAENREALIAVFGVMGGLSGAVALFVVAGTFSLAIAQRRRETGVLRALGATPRQVRRLVSAEALIVAAVAGGLGLLLGAPLARGIVSALAAHDVVPAGFRPGHSWIPAAAAFGGGLVISQLAVIAAARRAGRTRPAEALREAAVEHGRPSLPGVLVGLACLAGGIAMAVVFSGVSSQSFAVLTGLVLAAGVGLLGRLLLGWPATLLGWPLRAFGATGLLAGANLAANRWRTAALATPIVLVAMLAGTQGVVQSSDQNHTEDVTRSRVIAGHVLAGRDGAPLPAGTAAEVARLPGVAAAATQLPTRVFGLDHGLGEASPWAAAGLTAAGASRTLDLDVRAGDVRVVRGEAVAISRVLAHDGHLGLGDRFAVRLADTAPATLRVAAIYDRAAGIGDIVLDGELARAHTPGSPEAVVFVAGGARAERSLDAYAARSPGVHTLTRDAYLGTVHAANTHGAWGVWLIVALAAAFATLALINTAAMATGERRQELATLRLLGGTPAHAVRLAVLEMVPTVAVAVIAGGAIVLAAVAGVPRGITGVPVAVPLLLVGGLVGAAGLLGVVTAAVTSRLALRASPAEAMRARD